MKRGFTLSELAVTLGILGIFAVLILPTFISNYKKHVIETRLKKFYSSMNNAITMSEVEHGDKKDWFCTNCCGIDCLDYFNEYIGKYIYKLEIESFNDSLADYIAGYFNDGSMFIVKKDMRDWFFYPESKNFDFKDFEHVNGLRKGLGTNFWIFNFAPTAVGNANLHNKGIEAYKSGLGPDFTRDDLLNGTGNNYGCKSGQHKVYCTALIQYEGWKIPDDYPIKF
ncbi:MAG: type II secretion system GspH family protein [Heliobacteriaceae bacterium]|jgi:prepilin-type N-terminal cleavage/methylation domain-containing protein|nr:type II secretion system GspH family protein [Heliobacteriaceae bacterium]